MKRQYRLNDFLIEMSAPEAEQLFGLTKESQTIYDCTPEQYYIKEQQPPYDKGKRSSWYGWKGRPLVCTMNLVKRVAIHENIFLDDIETFVDQNNLNQFLKSS